MIEWISSWLQDIIIIVLLATFVELLLPSSTMQKYARMVMGLLVILTIISPILSIFSSFSVPEIVNKLENQAFSMSSVPVGQRIEGSYNQADLQYQEKLMEQTKENMYKEAAPLVKRRFDVMLNHLKLDAELVNQEWVIHKIYLYVSDIPRNSKANSGENEVQNVSDIEAISVDNISINQPLASNEEEQKVQESGLANEIGEFFEAEWGIDKEKIEVFYDAG